MSARVLMIITGDPRTSARPIEALRIAAGIAVWKKVEMSVYLRGEAALLLSDSLDNEDCRKFWPLLVESSRGIFTQRHPAAGCAIDSPVAPFTGISDEKLAELAGRQKYVMRF